MTSVLLAVATVRLRTMHRVALAASGFDVHTVEAPAEIANRLARSGVDLMVIDVTARFGASALLTQLARDARMPARVLALTPVDEPPVVLAALDAGADDYLPITAGAERIVAAVRRLAGSGPAERVPAAIPASDRGVTDGS